MDNLTWKLLKEPSYKLTYNWGINDSKTAVWQVVDGKTYCKPAFLAWRNMVKRVHGGYQQYKSYADCTIHPSWKNFSVFEEWYDKHVIPGYSLDKDLKILQTKEYGPETALFIPSDINIQFRSRSRGYKSAHYGIAKEGIYYRVSIKNKYIEDTRLFSTEEEAIRYRAVKYAETLSQLAEEYNGTPYAFFIINHSLYHTAVAQGKSKDELSRLVKNINTIHRGVSL